MTRSRNRRVARKRACRRFDWAAERDGTSSGVGDDAWRARPTGGEMKTPSAILLLFLDSARADRFSAYGYHRRTTPNIDALAVQGTVYVRHYTGGTETLPGHLSVFTGVPAAFLGAPLNL